MLRKLILLGLIGFIFTRHAKFNGCKIELNTNYEQKAPIYLGNQSNHFTLLMPNKGSIKIKIGEAIVFGCPGQRNILTRFNSNLTTGLCHSKNQFHVTRSNVAPEEILCKKTVKADILESRGKCGEKNGVLISIGYGIMGTKWINLIKICYDKNTVSTFYTQHDVIGGEIEFASKTKFRPSFSNSGLGNNINLDDIYKNQKTMFGQILQSSGLTSHYINEKSFLSRGHLSPDADFLLSTWQYATYFYINTCPQWQTINSGNWGRIENMVRKTAKKFNKTLKITTGTHDVLKLPNENGKLQKITLLNDKVIVPKFVWKIVFEEESKAGIVLIILNNPFVSKVTSHDLLCENVCDLYGWASKSWNNLTHGFVHCCDVNDFLRVVKTAPNIRVDTVLNGIN